MTDAAQAIPYDASRDALYHPERRAPLAMAGWPQDAVAAEFARLAYFRFEDDPAQQAAVEAAVGAIGYARCGWFAGRAADTGFRRFDARGFAAVREDGHAIVAFRGTRADSLQDLLTDAHFIPVSWPLGGKVHTGFRNAFEGIRQQIERWLARAAPTSLTVTGHSLGAALATLLAGTRDDAELVTFGSPRVGDGAFAALFRDRAVRRYVDCTDIVTQVPPPPFFAHLDGLCFIDHAGKVRTGEHPPLSLLADRAIAQAAYLAAMWHPDNVHLRSFADHAPINYVSAVLGVRTGP